LIEYKGYKIRESSGGGKAGKGYNKTGSLQLIKDQNEGYLIKYRTSYKIGSKDSYSKALARVIKKANELRKSE